MISADTMIIRALNSSRSIFLPSYVGLRILAEQIPINRFKKNWLYNFLDKKLKNRNIWGYYNFKQLKHLAIIDKPEYRDMTAGSPLTMLVESYILYNLSKLPSFRTCSSVYSYQWADNDQKGVSFDYFMKYYKFRNKCICGLLESHSDTMVSVFDLRNFYPSINQDHLLNTLKSKLNFQNSRLNVGILDFTEYMLSFGGNKIGIPVGPELSHVLGNIALEKVDDAFEDYFRGCYFRYVDDIIIVHKTREKKKIQDRVIKIIEDHGFHNHEEKMCDTDANSWLINIPEHHLDIQDDPFKNLMERIIKYLLRFPEKENELIGLFINEGFTLPFTRMKSQSKYKRYLKFLRIVQTYKKPKSLIKEAVELRTKYEIELKRALKGGVFKEGMKRRWQIQKIRYYLNRLIYLYNRDSYTKLLDVISEYMEFNEIRILLKAIIEDDYLSIINLPGRVARAYCEISTEIKCSLETHIVDDKTSDVELGSLSLLALYNLINLKMSQNMEKKIQFSEFVKFCNGDIPKRRILDDFSFIDELRTLQIGVGKDQIYNYLTSRYNDEELFGLFALRLGGLGYNT